MDKEERNKYMREYHEKNKERINKRNREIYANDTERIRKRNKKWRTNNESYKIAHRRRAAEYRRNHPEKTRQASELYYKHLADWIIANNY